MKRPGEILEAESCKTELLSISDQHITVLLTESKASGNDDQANDNTVKSLLKMNVIPLHRRVLASAAGESISEEKLMSFLRQYDYRLTSESGAEYSFYEATKVAEGGIFAKLLGWTFNKRQKLENHEVIGGFNVELISPASEKQINRARPCFTRSMIVETKELYDAVTKPFIEKQKESLSWLQNIIEGKKEKERLLYDAEHWLLNIDTKWRSHPDPLTAPKEEWLNHPATSDLYCLGIFKLPNVATIRDLTHEHIAILQDILHQGSQVILNTYGVQRDQLRIFVHYQPQFYHFHVHFTRLENEFGCQVERGHLLEDIIQNLEFDSEYYIKKSISYVLRSSDKLYQEIETYRKGAEE